MKAYYFNFIFFLLQYKCWNFVVDVDEDGTVGIVLPSHMRCAAHTLNLVATTDADKAPKNCSTYKVLYRSAFAKAHTLWNKQSR